jgi:hypothetical protein
LSGARSKVICFDLDGTICTNTGGAYETAEPFPWAIERVNRLYDAGHEIIVFTARGTATGIDWDELTRGQLDRWGVRYHDLRFGKPSGDVFVDDRAVHTDAWRFSDVSVIPGLGVAEADEGEQIPELLPPHVASVIESGRTFGGRPHGLEELAARLLARAQAAGIDTSVDEREIVDAVETGLGAAGDDPDDHVFSAIISQPPTAAYVDAWAAGPPKELAVSVRSMRQVAAGLEPMLAREGAVHAATDGRPGAWPLRDGPEGLRDRLGGRLAASVDGDLVEDGVDRELARRADSLLILGLPFCALRVATLDGEALGEDDSARLAALEQWSTTA